MLITFDGLFSSALRNTLEPDRAYSWLSRTPKIGKQSNLIVVGHSLGGPAAIKFCADHGYMIDLLITLDPRVFGQPYIKPSNVKKAVNFYRNSFWMRGYPVQGAVNNIETVGHMQLVGLKEVRSLIDATR